MAKFYTLGCYTAKGLGGFVSNPSTDRKAATSALAASCLLYTSPSPRDQVVSRMPSSA